MDFPWEHFAREWMTLTRLTGSDQLAPWGLLEIYLGGIRLAGLLGIMISHKIGKTLSTSNSWDGIGVFSMAQIILASLS